MAGKPAPAKKAAAPAAKPVKKGKPVSRLYEISGNSIKKKNKICPKCGDGTYMANHKDRTTCGKCNYMERR